MKLVLLGSRYQARLDEPLRRRGLEPLYLPENPCVDPRLAGHADLSVFRKGERIWLAPWLRDTEVPEKLMNLGYSVTFAKISLGQAYPMDAALNLCSVGNYLLAAKNAHPADIVNNLTSVEGMRPVWIRQGYARCSCCVVDETSLITADRGIASACEAVGLQVLLISPGSVALPGFAYGFVGGASFFVSEKSIAFTGSLQGHPDGDRILRFLDARGVTAQPLSAGPLVDIGGAFVFEPNIT